MQDKEKCLVPNLEHDYQFRTAAYGQSCWQCNICGEWSDVYEDSQP